jgi:hypothetical protein
VISWRSWTHRECLKIATSFPLILKLSKNYTRIRNAHPFPKVDPKLFERRMCRRVGPGGFRRINDDSILKAAPKPNRRRNNKRASEQNAHAKSSSDFVDTNVPWLRPPHCVLRAIAEKKNKCPHQALGPIVEPALLELAEASLRTNRHSSKFIARCGGAGVCIHMAGFVVASKSASRRSFFLLPHPEG